MKQSEVERVSDIARRRLQVVLLNFAASKFTIGETIDAFVRALRPRRSRDTERLKVGDLVVPTNYITTVRRIDAFGIWTGGHDRHWWECRSQDNLMRVCAKGRGGV